MSNKDKSEKKEKPDKKDKKEMEHRRKKKRCRSHSKDRSPKTKHSKKIKDNRRRTPNDDADVQPLGSSLSLSVEETNKLRAKLGLAPLDLGNDETKGSDGLQKPSNGETEFIHAPAKNLTDDHQTERIKEKLASMKEKRELLNKLREVQPLSAEVETSTLSWIDKMRAKEKEKKAAEEREKILAAMDEEFGVSQLVAAKMNETKRYSSSDLSGLKVEHKADRLLESGPVILTLKDKGILEEDESDVLVNVNLIDDEKAEKNIENKRKTGGFGGVLQDEDEDVIMGLREKGVLEKYDAEIDGAKKNNFTLEIGGTYSSEHEIAMRRLQQELRAGSQSVNDYEMRVASEYYSPAEMTQFRKRKHKGKAQHRQLNADDLMAANILMTSSSSTSRDHGSRSRRNRRAESLTTKDEPEEGEVEEKPAKTGQEIVTLRTDDSMRDNGLNPAIAALLDAQTVDDGDDLTANYSQAWDSMPMEADDLQVDLERALERVRRSNLAKMNAPDQIAKRVLETKHEEEASIKLEPKSAETSITGSLFFDSTEEFFKQITGGLQSANQAKYNLSLSEARTAADTTEIDRNGVKIEPSKDDSNKILRVSSAHRAGKSRSSEQIKQKSDPTPSLPKTAEEEGRGVLDDEPELNQGVFSALLLARKKGYVEEDKQKEFAPGNLVNLMAKNYVQEDVRYDDIDAKFSKRERYCGPLSDFREKTTYKPEVQLHYVDEMGRTLTPKEAFRQLSHKFHGKGSGKKKIEKRTKKIMEETLLRGSESSDTPLGTVEKLNKKLQNQGVPYVVLSGKNVASKTLMK